MINVTYVSRNADEARRVVNSIVRKFVIKDKEWTNKYAINSVSFLDSLIILQEKKIEASENEKMKFMVDNNLYSMEAKSNVIISQINSYEMDLYGIDTELSIKQNQIDLLKSKFSKLEKKLTGQLLDNINIQLLSLRDEVGSIKSNIALNSRMYGDDHGSVIELQQKLSLIKAEINEKVDLLIEKGIAVDDPLELRKEQISNIMELENLMLALKLERKQKENVGSF